MEKSPASVSGVRRVSVTNTAPSDGSVDALLVQLHLLDSHSKGDRFEELCAWLLQRTPDFSEIDKVWRWDHWPGRWGADAGIDLVARTKDGGLWAVQAKAYAPEYAIKKADIDSFLSESSRAVFEHRLILATTDKLGPTAQKTLDNQEKSAGFLGLTFLRSLDVDWPSSLDAIGGSLPTTRARLQPRPHQVEALAAITEGFLTQDRGQLLMCCGTGKTLTALWASEQLGADKCLVLVPSLSLIAQVLREWRTQASEPITALAVCSDPSVGATRATDAFAEHASEVPARTTSSSDEVKAFLQKPGRRVVFATYQSSGVVRDAQQDPAVPAFDLAIADEAHRCAGRIDRAFGMILDGTTIRASRRVFMTATPRIFTPQASKQAEDIGVQVASMDDEAVFGPVLYRMTFSQAVTEGLLCDYQIVVVGVTRTEALELIEQRKLLEVGDGAEDAETLARLLALSKTIRSYDLRRVISFHSTVKNARATAALLPAASPCDGIPLWAEVVHGGMSAGARRVQLERLADVAADECGVLTNARCLSEGIDIPAIDGVAFLDPKESVVDIVQAVGRVMRRSDQHKTVGTILVPVIIPEGEDDEDVLDSSSFKTVWRVVAALRAHDETLADEIDAARVSLGKHRLIGRRPGKIHFDLGSRIPPDFEDAIDVRLVESTSRSWLEGYGALLGWVAEGNAVVMREDQEHHGFPLGKWVYKQKWVYRHNELRADRVEMLEEISEWTWGVSRVVRSLPWQECVSRLKSFAADNDHAHVPRPFENTDGFRLGHWVNNRRADYRQGKLSLCQTAELESIAGWQWEVRTTGGSAQRISPAERARRDKREESRRFAQEQADQEWLEAFSRIAEFGRRSGHILVEHADDALWKWLVTQIDEYRKGRVSADRCALLRELPNFADTIKETRWLANVYCVSEFQRKHGNLKIPEGYKPLTTCLKSWIQNQKAERANMPPERQRILEAIPGWTWSKREDRWDEWIAALDRYVQETGSTVMREDYIDPDGRRLGKWCGKQRTRYRQGLTAADRIAALEAMPGWVWDGRLNRPSSGRR